VVNANVKRARPSIAKEGKGNEEKEEGLCFSTCAVYTAYTPFMHGAYHICIHTVV
jgi:hypothetical protein